MSILVTGGAGYIGSHMVWRLVDEGESVQILDNLSTGFDWAIPGSVPLHKGDVGDEAFLDALFSREKIDAVIHFAGSVIVPESVSDPLKYYSNNTGNSRNLIAACVRHRVEKFIFSSTAAVYGDPEVVPVEESAALKPLSPYGTSKLMTEQMLADTAAAHNFRYVALRYFNVAGAEPSGRTGQSTANATHLIKVACEAALGKRNSLSVYGSDYDTPDGTGVRDYIHVWDLALAHQQALRALNSGADSAIYNCGYGSGFSVRQVIESVKRISGVEFTVKEEPRRAGDSPKVIANPEKIRNALDWQPAHDELDEIVSHALAWENKLSQRNLA
ncbi:MAG: UDP-glucose 4-epimerase GalE [Stappiaceae bacterium]